SDLKSANKRLPHTVGMPATLMLSLTVTGTPSTGDNGCLLVHRSALACAAACAPSTSKKTTAFKRGLTAARRVRQLSNTSTGVKRALEYPCVSSVADSIHRFTVDVISAPTKRVVATTRLFQGNTRSKT